MPSLRESFMTRAVPAVVALSALFACEPRLTVGEWTCPAGGTPDAASDVNAPMSVPWSTSFEDRFCDYMASAGFCYGAAPASYVTVTSHAHSGRHAAAFSVDADDDAGFQARCVRQG